MNSSSMSNPAGECLLMLLSLLDDFLAPISTISGASLTACAATDLSGDGKADVVGVFDDNLLVYINNGDGTFGRRRSLPAWDFAKRADTS